MPELPEVETIAADLRPHLVGRTILRCVLGFPSIVRHPEPELFADHVAGRRISSVGRRGKFILVHLDGDLLMVVHLGMTGQLRLVDPATALQKHTHAVFDLDDGTQLRYRDPRRFGRLLLGTEEALLASRKLPRLGPEPIDPGFAPDELYRRLRRRRTSLKAVLLDQAAIAGVGNIYADEALWRARIHPLTPAEALGPDEVKALYRGIRDALRAGIRRQGSTLRDYRLPNGEEGGAQHEFKVYGRGGEPCNRCGTPIDKTRVAGRGTWYCPSCQPRQAASSSSRRPSRSRRHNSV